MFPRDFWEKLRIDLWHLGIFTFLWVLAPSWQHLGCRFLFQPSLFKLYYWLIDLNLDSKVIQGVNMVHVPVVWKLNQIFNFFLHCQHFIESRQTLLDSAKEIVNDISNLTDDVLVNLLLYGSQTFNFEENITIIKASIKYILSTERFSGPLIWPFNISNYIKSINICIWSYPFLQTLIWTIHTVKCWMLNFYPFYCSLNFFRR